MSLAASSSFSQSSNPERSAELAGGSYVLAIAALENEYAVLSSAPSNKIHLYDRASLRPAASFDAHAAAGTSLRSVDNIHGTSRRVLLSSGKDATVKVWDARTPTPALTMKQAGTPRALICADVAPDGMMIAAGAELKGEDAPILYWDPRAPAAPLRAHASTHSDDVTALHFSRAPGAVRLLLSASSDGLLSLSSADEEDEDEAVVHVGNWGCSIAQAGWMPEGDGAWASSDMETFSTWSSELDSRANVDIRAPSLHTAEVAWVTDYLIGSHASERGGFSVFVGSNEGDVALLKSSDWGNSTANWELERLFVGGHSGVVRSMLWDEQNNILLTGGEDARLHAWACPAPTSASATDAEMSSFSPRKRDLDGDVEMGNSPESGKKKARR
ncbi:WD40 repeat-like protein [Peniophora sp. CONT]|nr:WD40 repeat-like protein [Peniophora sp. CONT]